MPDKTFNPSQIPGLKQAADAASMVDVYFPNVTFDSETGQYFQYGGGEYASVPDPAKQAAYIDTAMQDPTKWVANNLNWSGLGDRGDFSALDDQIKFLKDNKYDTSTLDKGAMNHYNLTKQIIGQGTTGRWTGQGFGSPIENAKHMASTLITAGIDDIKDFGKSKKQTYETLNLTPEYSNAGDASYPTGRYFYADPDTGSVRFFDEKDINVQKFAGSEPGDPGYATATVKVPAGEQQVYVNKKTGKDITQAYNQAYGDIFSGTYAGHGRTNFGVKFANDGTPYFYTQFGGDTSSMADIAPFIAVLSIIPSPLQPFAMAANALISLDSGNTLGALASLAGIPGISEAVGAAGLASVAEGIKTANQVVNLVNAIDSGNVVGAITAGASLSGANVGSTQIGDTGFTVSDAMKAANLVSAIASEDQTAIFKAATSFANSPNIKKSLDNTSTTLDVNGQKIAEVDPKEFVAELKNPDSPNFLGDVDKKLDEVAIQPGTQLATTDKDTAIKAIEDLISKGAFQSETPRSVEEMVKDIAKEEEPEVNVIPGENGTQLVLDKDGNVVDMIPEGTTPSIQLDQVDPSRKPAVENVDQTEPAQTIVGEPAQKPSDELLKIRDILNDAGGNVTIDANGLLVDASDPVNQPAVVDDTAPTEDDKPVFQGPMGPMTEDKIKRYNDEFARYLDYLQAGSPPPEDFGPGPIGMTGDYWDEFDKNMLDMKEKGELPSQWKSDEEGNFTYVADDGSTLTLGPDGQVVHHTDAPEGNLPGETPAQEPAKEPAKDPAKDPAKTTTTTPATKGPGLDWGQMFKNAAGIGAVVAGGKAVGDLLTGDNQPTQQTAPKTQLKMDWNQAEIQAPQNGIAYGQQYFNPVFTEIPAAQGGLMSLAGGGMLGSYSDGGRLLRGPGDGMSDHIPASIAGRQPARLADGEFVIPADVVSHLGNGSTEAGSRVLYDMMERIRKARTGNPKQGKQINPSKFMPK